MKIVLTGATGFIGKRLLTHFSIQNHELIALARNPDALRTYPCRAIAWDSNAKPSKAVLQALENADAVVHLAGEPIAAERWSEETKKRILSSRVDGTKYIVAAIAGLPDAKRPKVLISGSATGFYGNRGDERLTEESPPGQGFLPDVVQAWEKEAMRAADCGVRVVCLRTGIVLGHEGGALQKMKAVTLGSGKQWMSWIHIEDLIRLIDFAIAETKLVGACNGTAPEPATNADFTRSYARATGAPLSMKAPGFALRAILGEMSQIVLEGARVLPKRALDAGFSFQFPTLDSALHEIYTAPLERRFSAVQFVPKPLAEVFNFFSQAENLETITPPWLLFRIVGMSTPSMGSGTLIDYKLKIHGVPVLWQSKIEAWDPPRAFVDTQTKGPYSKWHHTHRFESVPGGTLVMDEVVYRMPGGFLGNALGGSFVRGDVETIFGHRRNKIEEILGA